MSDALSRAVALHRERWGEPEIVSRAPGRVNLIGEHTDYNEGFALPMALPFDTVVAMSAADQARVSIVSAGFGDVDVDPEADPRSTVGWAVHIAGVVSLMGAEGLEPSRWRGAIDTDIPTGASLSSSAALEVAIVIGLLARAGVAWPPIEIARLGQRVENEVVGLPSGIMDQFISAGATAGHAGLLDCRALTLTPTPLPESVVVAVMDTGTRRVLAEAAYGERRASCERAANELGVPALRDAELDQLSRICDPTDQRRAHHVVAENRRTLDAAAAMRSGDVVELGRLMRSSHASLRDDYEVSGPGLDAIVAVADGAPGCLGARMTGGGFAGCAVALVERDAADAFAAAILDGYSYGNHTARVWCCEPAAGASIVDPADR